MHTNGQQHIVQIGGETFDLREYDFPTRMDSPDPKAMIEAIREAGGVLTDAADVLGCGKQTIYNWTHRYEPIRAAVEDTRASIGVEAKETLVELMRSADDRTRYKAACKLASTYHPRMDFSRKERREISRKEKDETESRPDVEEMDQDALLEELNETIQGEQ